MSRLAGLLRPLAERNGHRKCAGDALREELMQIAGIDQESIAKQIWSIPSVARLVAARHLENSRGIATSGSNAALSASGESSATSQIEGYLRAADSVSIAQALRLK